MPFDNTGYKGNKGPLVLKPKKESTGGILAKGMKRRVKRPKGSLGQYQ